MANTTTELIRPLENERDPALHEEYIEMTAAVNASGGCGQEQQAIEHPTEAFTAEDNANTDSTNEYPTGPKLWFNMGSVLICCFLRGLDLTIVAVAVPAITDDFHTITDIGFYNSAYMLSSSAVVFFFGKFYTLFNVKRTYLASIFLFLIGSTVCTFAPTSKAFIIGRAISGFGSAAQQGGLINVFAQSFSKRRRPAAVGVAVFVQTVAMVMAPVLGGVLITKFSWRVCFGINIPGELIAFIVTAFCMEITAANPDEALPLRTKLMQLDIPGTLIVMPSVTCLIIALQFGGVKYGWSDSRIVVMLVVCAVLFIAFAMWQYHKGDNATIPPRIIKNRSIIGTTWFNVCMDGTLAVTEYYISIYFQGVRGYTAAKSGLLGVPMIAGLCAASLLAGFGTSWMGYANPFMLLTSFIAPVASGLLTTIDPGTEAAKASGLLGLLGFAIGLGIQAPMSIASTILGPNELSIGNAIQAFGSGMSSAIFSSAAAGLFETRLKANINQHASGTNVTALEQVGLSDIRHQIGAERLRQVLVGYDDAVMQTLYLPLTLITLSIVGTIATGWHSVKEKRS